MPLRGFFGGKGDWEANQKGITNIRVSEGRLLSWG